MKLKIGLLTLSLVLSIVLGELVLRIFGEHEIDRALIRAEKITLDSHAASLSVDERDITLPLFTSGQNANCLSFVPIEILRYHPYFGFFTKSFDNSCLLDSFANRSKPSVVFFGGSVMRNLHSVNFLTTLDSQIQKINPTVNSVNLAESGARLSNELHRMVEEVVDVRPQIAIFLDGYNEFNSIRFGGAPSDDFYWTAGVKLRVEDPIAFIVDRLIKNSAILSLALLKTGLVQSSSGIQQAPQRMDIEAAADSYLKNLEKIQEIGKAYKIRTIFFLQPHIFSGKKLTKIESDVARLTLKTFPGTDQVLRLGYDRIRSAGANIVDLSRVFDESEEEIFIDAVHIGKNGNKILGRAMGESLKNFLSEN